MSDDPSLLIYSRASVLQTQAINITNIKQINLYNLGNNNTNSSHTHDDTIFFPSKFVLYFTRMCTFIKQCSI